MGKAFRAVTLSIAGNFKAKEEKVRQWVEANGGTFSKDVNSNVTHLVATKAAFSKPDPAVRAAKRIKGIKVVSIDWLEESLLSKSHRPKREGPYLWSRIIKTAKKKEINKKDAKKGSAGNAPSQKKKPSTELDGHHIYKNEAGFRYAAILIRPTAVARFKEKHMVKLFESDATPYTYATFVKYTRRGRTASDFVASPGSTWQVACAAFDKFFKAKSGKDWDQRHKKLEPKRSREGDELPVEEGWFEYQAEESTAQAAAGLKEEEYDEAKAIAATTAMLQDAIQQMEAAEAAAGGGGSGDSEDTPIDLDGILAEKGPTGC